MPTCRDIITTALRKCRVIGSGDTPSAEDAADAMGNLQGLYDSWANSGVFGRLTDVLATESGEAREYTRVRYETGVTITLPLTLTASTYDYGFPDRPWDYGFQASQEERPPLNRALIVLVNMTTGVRSVNLYNANAGAWLDLLDLDLEDEAPLAELDRDGLASCLAVSIADEHGATLAQTTAMSAARFQSLLSNRYDATRRDTQAEYF